MKSASFVGKYLTTKAKRDNLVLDVSRCNSTLSDVRSAIIPDKFQPSENPKYMVWGLDINSVHKYALAVAYLVDQEVLTVEKGSRFLTLFVEARSSWYVSPIVYAKSMSDREAGDGGSSVAELTSSGPPCLWTLPKSRPGTQCAMIPE